MRPLYPLNRAAISLLILFLLSALTFQSQAQSGSVTTTQSFSYTGQIVTYTVPTGVTSLTIEARGAEGGNNTASDFRPGKGASITGTISVMSGQQLKILVGEHPSGNSNNGGDGSFVTAINNNPLIIAGGGGGSGRSNDSNAKNGQTGRSGGDGAGGGGSGGTNGSAGAEGGAGNGSGGGGVLTDALMTGGGAGGDGIRFGAGGGGYSGGGGGGNTRGVGGVGGGGGSFNGGTNQTNTGGANIGDGLVTITYATPPQPIRYVKAGGSGRGDGTSWANASGDLQSQINIAGAQQVWVAGGRYTTTANNGSFLLKNGVIVYGGFVGSENSLGDRPGVNPVNGQPSSTTLTTASRALVLFNNNLDNTARLDGVVITGGNNNFGGGIYNSSSSPILTNCLITGNSSTSGGGIYSQNGSPVLTNCLISGNTATNLGGGIYNLNSSPSLTNCTINGNTASDQGGGMYNRSGSSPVLTNCLLANNTATNQGGAIHNYQNSNPRLVNCTLTGNSAGDQGGAISEDGTTSQLTNAILWNNGGAKAFRFLNSGSTTLTYSLIESGATGYTSSPTNQTATVSPFTSGTDFTLRAGSQAIDAGDPASTTATSGATDLAGNPRVFNGRIDQGAYESQVLPQPIRYVKAGGSGTGDGTSWPNASGDLQSQIDIAGAQQVWVAGGRYTITANNRSFSLKNGVIVYGGFVGSENSLGDRPRINPVNGQPSTTTLTTASRASVFFNNNLNNTARLDGVVITGGNTTEGGGILNNNSSPVLTNCLISGNSADFGGGINNFNSSPTLTNCTINGNTASDQGGGIYNFRSSSPVLTNCLLASNTATNQGGAFHNYQSSNPRLVNCTLTGNSAGDQGGAISEDGTTSQLTNAILWNNGGAKAFRFINNGSTSLTYSLIESGATGYTSSPTNQTATVSPFVSNTDFTLKAGSQAIDAGDPASTTATSGATDLAGNPRVFNGRIDQGAYESQVLPQPIRYVKQGGSGTGDGTSWPNASGDLQSQINIAGAQQVWVAGGRYTTTANGGSFSLKNGVAVYGGFVGNEQNLTDRPGVNPVNGQPSSTTLTATATSVFRNSGLTNAALLDGVVITGGRSVNQNEGSFNQGGGIYNDGSSPVLTNCLISGNSAGNGGGGIYNSSSSPSLTNCLISGNSAIYGGGIYNDQSSSQPVLTNCLISGNTAAGRGGGIYNNGSSPRLANCTISGNSTNNVGGGIYNELNSSPVLTNCTVSSNTSSQGGGIYNEVSSPNLTNCTIKGNTASGQGGGLYNANSSPVLTNCLLSDNSANTGGGLFNNRSSPRLVNCTLTANRAGAGAALNNVVSSQPSLTNTILWDNGGSNAIVSQSDCIVSANYCLIEAGETDFTGSNNQTATVSPFVSSTNRQLNACSVAINAGSDGAYTGPATDLAGNTRSVRQIDLGALEFQGTPTPSVAITQQPASGSSVCVGSTVTAMVSVSGTSPTYQWYKDGTSLGAAQQAATLTLTNVQPASSGSYSVVVTGSCNSVTSSAFSLTVNAPPTAGLTNNGPISCSATSVTLTASGGASYRFSSGAAQIGNGNTATVSSAGVYSVTVVSTNGCSATASTTVAGDQSVPTASLTNNGPLSCSMTSVTLTASGGSMYRFSNGVSQIDNTPTATVSQAGVYSVTVVSSNGCSAAASTTVTGSSIPPTIPTLMTSATLTLNQPISVTASGCNGTLNWNLTGGAGAANGSIYTISQPGSYTLSASCSLNGCTSASSPPLVLRIDPAGALTLLAPGYDCATGAFTFNTASGDGSPIEYFAIGITPWTSNPNQRIEAELRADPKKIQLLARQQGITVSYLFDLPAYCAGLPTPPQSSTNPAPVAAQGINAQVAMQQQPYSFSIPVGTFTDPEGEPLTYYALALPVGLSLSGSVISGTPTTVGRVVVTLIAVDPSGQTANTSFWFTVEPPATDLTPTLYARPTTIHGAQSISVVVDVMEIKGIASHGPITLRLSKDARLSLSLDGSLTTVSGHSVQNQSWSLTGPSGGFYTLTTTEVIAGGGKLSVGLTGMLIPGATTGSLSVSSVLVGGSGGEVNSTNNSDADKIDYFPQ